MAVERISEAEYEVMEMLWDNAPMTASDVAELVAPERQWSPQTVKTLLSRLAAKGAITFREDGRRYLYEPVLRREDYIEGESRRLMDRLFNGRAAPLFAHLAEREAFSDEDIAEIEALLKGMKS